MLRAVVVAVMAALAIGAASSCGGDLPDPPRSISTEPPAPAAPVARVETTDGWLDLIAQRPNAVPLQNGAVVLDLSSPAARSSLALSSRSQWRLAEQVEGRPAAILLGRGGAVDLPVDGELAALIPAEGARIDEDATPPLAMAISVVGLTESQSMTVLLNERPLAHLKLREGWQRRTFSLPSEVVRPGENRVRLHFRNSVARGEDRVCAAVSRIELGTHERITDAPGGEDEAIYGVAAANVDASGSLSVRGSPSKRAERTLLLAPGSGLAYYVEPPPRSRLVLDIKGEGAVRVAVSTDADHAARRAPTVVLDEPLRPTGHRPTIDLSAWGDIPIRIALEVRSERGDAPAELSMARIDARRTVPVDRRARRLRDVVIVAVEGMRADVLEIGRRPSLPALDDFVAGSLLFERAYAPSPAAVPSHSAWLSSVAPVVHLTTRGTFVADGQVLLPEALGRAGFTRTLLTANVDVNRDRGLTQGIDRYQALDGIVDENSAGSIVEALLRGHKKGGKRFTVLNLSDPQAPYEPQRELIRDVEVPPGSPLPHLTHIWVGRVRLGKTEPSETELAYMRRLYRGELQAVDQALGRLIESLRREERLDEAVIVLMGVHGEEFLEHGGAGHARTLHEESLRVPLAIHAPQLLAPGRVAAPVDLVDVAPTVLDLIGVPIPDIWQGESLVPVIDDPQPPPRLSLAYLGDGSRAAIVGRHKLVLGPGRQERYFDLRDNPDEEPAEDSTSPEVIGTRIVRSALAWQLDQESQWRRARWGTGANLSPAFAQDLGM